MRVCGVFLQRLNYELRMLRFLHGVVSLIALFFLAHVVGGQALQPTPTDAVRVTVSVNPDGSRTAYEFDLANHKARATTKGSDGKLRGTIQYTLDEAGRFASGEVFGPDKRLRFKTVYKYGDAGTLAQETQLDKNDAVLHKIIYAYDSIGKQTGYSVYDASGKLISQTAAPNRSPAPAKKKSR
jgi:hypothetical protein